MGGQETTLVWPVRYSGQIPNTRYSSAASDLRTQGMAAQTSLASFFSRIMWSGRWTGVENVTAEVRGADVASESAELGWG